MKTATVNGQPISEAAVNFELDRLVRFYANHGISADEVRKSLPILREKALEQAIGAKLLLERAAMLDMRIDPAAVDAEVAKVVSQVGGEESYRKALADQGIDDESFRRELEKGVRVNALVADACSHVGDPTEEDVASFYAAHRGDYAGRTIVDVHDEIKDLLRHEARGRAMDAYVAELRESAKIEYREVSG